jgi:hypothetical protein
MTGTALAFPSTASSTTLRALGGEPGSTGSEQSLLLVLDQSPLSSEQAPPAPSSSASFSLGSFFGGGGGASRFPKMAADGTLSHEAGAPVVGARPGSPTPGVLAPALFPSSPGADNAGVRVGPKTGERLWGAAAPVGAAPSSMTAAAAVASPRKWGWKW